MGVKISDLTAATTIGGSELAPVIQSTETRQTSVSALFSGLTAQGDSRYVCDISECTQGCFTFSGADGGGISLGLKATDSPTFADLTVSGDIAVETDTIATYCSKVGIGTTTPKSDLTIAGAATVTGVISGESCLYVDGNTTLCGTISAFGMGTGTGCNVVVKNTSDELVTDVAQEKIFSSDCLLGMYTGCTSSLYYVPVFNDTAGRVINSCIVDNNGTTRIMGNFCTQGSTACFSSDVTIGSTCDLVVGGDLTVCGCLYLPNIPTSDPLVAGGVYRDGTTLKVSCCT